MNRHAVSLQGQHNGRAIGINKILLSATYSIRHLAGRKAIQCVHMLIVLEVFRPKTDHAVREQVFLVCSIGR